MQEKHKRGSGGALVAYENYKNHAYKMKQIDDKAQREKELGIQPGGAGPDGKFNYRRRLME